MNCHFLVTRWKTITFRKKSTGPRILEGPESLQMSQVCALPRGQSSVVRGQFSACPLHPVLCSLHPDRQTGPWCASSRLVGLRRCLAGLCPPQLSRTPAGNRGRVLPVNGDPGWFGAVRGTGEVAFDAPRPVDLPPRRRRRTPRIPPPALPARADLVLPVGCVRRAGKRRRTRRNATRGGVLDKETGRRDLPYPHRNRPRMSLCDILSGRGEFVHRQAGAYTIHGRPLLPGRNRSWSSHLVT